MVFVLITVLGLSLVWVRGLKGYGNVDLKRLKGIFILMSEQETLSYGLLMILSVTHLLAACLHHFSA
jgi:hypothetical protein